MDKEQVILEKLEQLRRDQLKALKELKKVEKAKKRKHRRVSHAGYPMKDSSSEQKKIHPAGERSPICVLGTTQNQTPEHGKSTSFSTSERKSLKECGSNAMVETPLKKQATSLKKQATSGIDHYGLMTDDKAKIGEVKANCRTTICRQETVSLTAEKVTSEVTEMLDWMSSERMEDPMTHSNATVTCTSSLASPITRNKEIVVQTDTAASCLTSPIAHNKETVIIPDSGALHLTSSITHNKETVIPKTGALCMTSPTTHNKETDITLDTRASLLTSPITCNKETVIPDTDASYLIITHNKETVIQSDTCASCLTSPITHKKDSVIPDTDTSCLTSPITHKKDSMIPDTDASCVIDPITHVNETIIQPDTCPSCLTNTIIHNNETVLRDTDALYLTNSITRDKETVIPDTRASCLTSSVTHNKVTVIPDTHASCLPNPITHGKETVMPDTDASCLTSALGLAHKKRTVIPVPSVIPGTGSPCPTSSVAHNELTVTSDTDACFGSITHYKKTFRSPNAGAFCLTDPIVHSKDTVHHDKNDSCPTESQPHKNPRRAAPSQTKEEEHFRFPKPNNSCLLETNVISDFVLPDKEFAVLKLEKLKQIRQSGLKEKTDVRFKYQPDSAANDSVGKCTTNNQSDCDDVQSSMGTTTDGRNHHRVYDSSQNTRDDGMLQSRKYDRNFESPCNVSPKNPPSRDNASFEDQFQNVFSESLLNALKTCNDCTWQTTQGTSGQHLSSDLLPACAISDVIGANDLNTSKDDGSTTKTSSNEFCEDMNRTIEEKQRCKNVSKAVEEDKQVAQSTVTSSTLTISQGHDDEDVMNREMATMSSNAASSDEKYVAENHNVCHSQSKANKNEVGSGDSTPDMSEFCFQHLNTLAWSSSEVRALKSLTLRNGETASQIMAVCLPRLLVLWKSTAGSTWIVLHKWVLNEEEEEFFELEITSVDSCVVVLVGGKFSKALGRVYCLLDRGDWNFDLCEEVSFPDIGKSVSEFKHMCLLPTKNSAENLSVVLACSTYDGRILLTKWEVDLMCFCIQDSEDFPELCGSDLSSLLTVDGTTCLLLGCLHSVIYLWNYNTCELLCKTSLQLSSFSRPVCLSAETSMGMLFLVLFYKECKEVKLVAVNPQSEREACLKTLDMAQMVHDPSDKVLSCSKRGSFVISSFTRGHILLWNIASDKTKLLNLFSGDVTCILLDHEESFIAFGTVSGSVYLNIMK